MRSRVAGRLPRPAGFMRLLGKRSGLQHEDLALADRGVVPAGIPFALVDLEVHVEPMPLAQPKRRRQAGEIGGCQILNDHKTWREGLNKRQDESKPVAY